MMKTYVAIKDSEIDDLLRSFSNPLVQAALQELKDHRKATNNAEIARLISKIRLIRTELERIFPLVTTVSPAAYNWGALHADLRAIHDEIKNE